MTFNDWLGPSISATGALIVFSVITRFAVRRKQRLQTFRLRRQYDADLRTWAGTTLSALTEAITATYLSTIADGKELVFRREEILSRLSATADQGRWFFPNDDPEAHGRWKPIPYRGFRPAILDTVIGAFDALRHVTPEGPINAPRALIVEHRRPFVSLLQERLDPRAHDAELAALMS